MLLYPLYRSSDLEMLPEDNVVLPHIVHGGY